MGIIAHIMDILKQVVFGHHYFKVALLLRDAMLVNGVLTNAEVWFGLTQSDIKKLEEVDKIFMRQLFRVPKTCPIESFYLETGKIPLKFVIKTRRITYLHHLLTRDKDEMLYKVFEAQLENPIKNDWITQVEDDLISFGIPIDFDFMKSFERVKFKEYV